MTSSWRRQGNAWCLTRVNIFMTLLHLGAPAVRIQTTTPIVEVFRGMDIASLECRYNTPPDDSILSINWYRKTIFDKKFQLIAQVPNSRSPVIVDLNMKRTSKLIYNRTDNTAIVRLVILNIQCIDDAEYQCEVQLYAKPTPKRADMRLIVYERPTIPKIVQYPATLTDNGNARFSCTAYTGKPQGIVRWVMVKKVRGREKEVELSGISSVQAKMSYCQTNGGIETSLQLSVSRFDVTLRCSVIQPSINGHRPVTMKSEKILDVKYSVRDIRATVTVNGKQVRKTKNILSYEGDTVSLSCASAGNPLPEYKWRFLPPSGTKLGALLLSKGHNQSKLTLTNITANHSGSYICVSNNMVELREYSQTTSVKLIVTERTDYETSSLMGIAGFTERVTLPKYVVRYVMIGGIVASTCIFVLFIALILAHCTRIRAPSRTYRGVPVKPR